jgi:hypothetical protein
MSEIENKRKQMLIYIYLFFYYSILNILVRSVKVDLKRLKRKFMFKFSGWPLGKNLLAPTFMLLLIDDGYRY